MWASCGICEFVPFHFDVNIAEHPYAVYYDHEIADYRPHVTNRFYANFRLFIYFSDRQPFIHESGYTDYPYRSERYRDLSKWEASWRYGHIGAPYPPISAWVEPTSLYETFQTNAGEINRYALREAPYYPEKVTEFNYSDQYLSYDSPYHILFLLRYYQQHEVARILNHNGHAAFAKDGYVYVSPRGLYALIKHCESYFFSTAVPFISIYRHIITTPLNQTYFAQHQFRVWIAFLCSVQFNHTPALNSLKGYVSSLNSAYSKELYKILDREGY